MGAPQIIVKLKKKKYLLEFSKTESRNRSADLEVSKNDKAADKLSFELSA